jgi:hypothetical protein
VNDPIIIVGKRERESFRLSLLLLLFLLSVSYII